MKRNQFFSLILLIAILASITIVFAQSTTSPPTEEPEGNPLAPYMDRKQPYSQKLGYAIRVKNAPLAKYYTDKIDELSSEIRRNVPEFEGHKIAELSRNFIPRPLRDIRAAINAEDWETAASKYVRLIDNCNECHKATKREFLIVLPAKGKPTFNQRFVPLDKK